MIPIILVNVLFGVLYLILITVFKDEDRTRELGISVESFNNSMNRNFENFITKFNKIQINARKRDEKILRRITEQNKLIVAGREDIKTGKSEISINIAGVAKQCRSIQTVAGQCKNDCKEINSSIPKMKKDIAQSVEVMNLFKAMTEKAKGSSYSAKK